MAVSERIFANASPLSLGGLSMFDEERALSWSRDSFISHPATIQAAISRLSSAGFDILHVTPYTINIVDPRDLFEKSSGIRRPTTSVPLPARLIRGRSVPDVCGLVA